MKPQWHKEVKEAILCRLPKDAAGFTSDPIYRTTGGWYFCDEKLAGSFGPFETEVETRDSLKEYAETL